MSAGCAIGLGQNFDLGLCIKTTLVDWTPDWLEPLLPWWPLAAVIIGAGVAYRLAGAPGLAAFAAAVGSASWRRSMEPTTPDIPDADREPPERKKKR